MQSVFLQPQWPLVMTQLPGPCGRLVCQTPLNEVWKLREWPRIPQLASSQAGTQIQVCFLQGPMPALTCYVAGRSGVISGLCLPCE